MAYFFYFLSGEKNVKMTAASTMNKSKYNSRKDLY